MLTLVTDHDRFADAQMLLRVGDAAQLTLQPVLLFLLGVVLLSAGQVWAFSFVGAAVALALSRYGPSWWPGRR